MSAMEPNGCVTNCNLDVYKKKRNVSVLSITKIASLWEWEFSKSFFLFDATMTDQKHAIIKIITMCAI